MYKIKGTIPTIASTPYSTMAENVTVKTCSTKRIRQPISVPFLWEEKPGTPKKDWKPSATLVSPATPPPVKLIASVPFKWEEKPGTALPYFTGGSFVESPPVIPPTQLLALASLAPLPPVKLIASVPFKWEEKPGTPIPYFTEPFPPTQFLALPPPPIYYPSYDADRGCTDDDQEAFELDLSFGFETDDSFSSAPSLLANCIVSSAAISSAIPVHETFSEDNISADTETYSSIASESDSCTTSYATGTSSLVGVSFLESLFPLLPPHSSLLKKDGNEESSLAPLELTSKYFDCESNSSAVIRRPTTLGELIMMSRRRSYQRKAIQMHKQNLSMKFQQRSAFGCGILETTSKMIEGLQKRKKHLPTLKLI